MNWMFLPLKRYADFSGRSRRKEYWMFFLLQVIIYAVVMVVGGMLLGSSMPAPGADGMYDEQAAAAMMGASSGLMLLYLVVALALLIPSIAVTVRRFHDQDKSGWLVLLGLIPFVGGLIVLVFMFLEGTRGPNRYGEDPKEGEA